LQLCELLCSSEMVKKGVRIVGVIDKLGDKGEMGVGHKKKRKTRKQCQIDSIRGASKKVHIGMYLILK